jgi:hypothetical protein
MPGRSIERNAPGAKFAIVNTSLWNVVNLRVLGSEFVVEGVDARTWSDLGYMPFAKAMVESPCLLVTESSVREPQCVIAAHG